MSNKKVRRKTMKKIMLFFIFYCFIVTGWAKGILLSNAQDEYFEYENITCQFFDNPNKYDVQMLIGQTTDGGVDFYKKGEYSIGIENGKVDGSKIITIYHKDGSKSELLCNISGGLKNYTILTPDSKDVVIKAVEAYSPKHGYTLIFRVMRSEDGNINVTSYLYNKKMHKYTLFMSWLLY